MYIAQMDTERYDYMSLGNTEADAKNAIRDKWNANQRTMKEQGWINTPHYYRTIEAMEKDYDITVFQLESGQAIMR